MHILYTVAILLSFIIGAITVLKAVQIGLCFKITADSGKVPTMDINPVTPVVEAVTDAVQKKELERKKREANEKMQELLYNAR